MILNFSTFRMEKGRKKMLTTFNKNDGNEIDKWQRKNKIYITKRHKNKILIRLIFDTGCNIECIYFLSKGMNLMPKYNIKIKYTSIKQLELTLLL